MTTKDEIHTWCHKLGDGRLEESGIEVKVAPRTESAQFSGFSVGLRPKSGKPVEFELSSSVADICIRRGQCEIWKGRLHDAIAVALSG